METDDIIKSLKECGNGAGDYNGDDFCSNECPFANMENCANCYQGLLLTSAFVIEQQRNEIWRLQEELQAEKLKHQNGACSKRAVE